MEETEDHEERVTILHSYAKKIYCGLILNGGFVEQKVPDLHTVISFDVLGEMNAGPLNSQKAAKKIPIRRTTEQMFRAGNRELSIREEDEVEQASQMCGRLEGKPQQLHERHWNLTGRGLQEAAGQVEKEMGKYQELLECAATRRDDPDRPRISGNTVP